MSKAAASNPGAAGYGANAGEPGATGRRCYTGTEFLSTAPGILNIVILVSKLLCLSNKKFVYEYYRLLSFVY
jgi:hypothetical protein